MLHDVASCTWVLLGHFVHPFMLSSVWDKRTGGCHVFCTFSPYLGIASCKRVSFSLTGAGIFTNKRAIFIELNLITFSIFHQTVVTVCLLLHVSLTATLAAFLLSGETHTDIDTNIWTCPWKTQIWIIYVKVLELHTAWSRVGWVHVLS